MSRPAAAPDWPLAPRVRVIGHRGAPAHFPEHTRAAYARAIDDGADFIEPDLVMSRDGVMVARHENAIGGTTDVAARHEFAGRRTTKVVDGSTVEGWFTEDFTIAELKTLRARERLPGTRSTAHDGRFPILTLVEIIELAAQASARTGRAIGIIPEIKHGTYFRKLGLGMEDALLDAFATHPYTRTAPLEIQSFEIGNLRHLHDRLGGARRHGRHPNIHLLQLIGEPEDQPWDIVEAGGTLTYATMMTPSGLAAVAGYADAIGPALGAVIARTEQDDLAAPTALVRDAHAAGLAVEPYTFRPENRFLARRFREGDDPDHRHPAGLQAQIRVFIDAGIDAFFTDDPAIGRRAVDAARA